MHKVSEQEGKFVGISAGADRVRGAADPGNHQTPTRTKGVARKGIVKRGATHENISISKWKVEMSQTFVTSITYVVVSIQSLTELCSSTGIPAWCAPNRNIWSRITP